MNDRELDIRVREAFDTLEVPDALRQRTLEAYDELAAAQAAEKGVEYTKTIIATKGRASYLGERSLGHQDPGATSSLYLLQVLAEMA